MFKYLLLSLYILSLAVLSGCASTSVPLGEIAYQPVEYKLESGDEVKIAVFGEERFNGQYKISTNGDISFPLIGNIVATDKSALELKETLEASLGAGYINDPRVTVEVMSYRPFYIMGEVQKSGKYEYADGLTALQAIALAGDFTYRADKRKVFIRRVGNGEEEVYDLQNGREIFISPGDTIRIGERYF